MVRGTSRMTNPRLDSRACYVEAEFLAGAAPDEAVPVAIVHDRVILGTSRVSIEAGTRAEFSCLLLDLPEPLACEDLQLFVIRPADGRPQFEPVAIVSAWTGT